MTLFQTQHNTHLLDFFPGNDLFYNNTSLILWAMSSNKLENNRVEELTADPLCTLVKWRDMGDDDGEGIENPE